MTREDAYALGNITHQNDHEAQLKAKDDEIRRLNNLYADTIKDLGDALIEIERLKNEVAFWKEDAADRERLGIIIDCLTSDCNKKDAEIAKLKEKYEAGGRNESR